ncbi:hypothetical protein B0H10DRAFT_2196992 [Mycena sp. CBHHK59/15]|nr:hypothetical protein B0H10DRAFT_2196992 [Mycena sp. CBHHK59/15]
MKRGGWERNERTIDETHLTPAAALPLIESPLHAGTRARGTWAVLSCALEDASSELEASGFAPAWKWNGCVCALPFPPNLLRVCGLAAARAERGGGEEGAPKDGAGLESHARGRLACGCGWGCPEKQLGELVRVVSWVAGFVLRKHSVAAASRGPVRQVVTSPTLPTHTPGLSPVLLEACGPGGLGREQAMTDPAGTLFSIGIIRDPCPSSRNGGNAEPILGSLCSYDYSTYIRAPQRRFQLQAQLLEIRAYYSPRGRNSAHSTSATSV